MKLTISCWAALLMACALFVLAGCGKNPQPTSLGPSTTPTPGDRRAPDRAPAPTIALSASPTQVERRGQATLSWQTTNAASVEIDNGVGNVSESGSLVIAPRESVTYTATATGAGGEAKASARVTVLEPTVDTPLATDDQRLADAIREGKVRDVFFAYDKADLTEEARQTLAENSRWFREFPGARVVIEGHCDERGSEEYNLALGDRRAQTAFDHLVSLGIDPARMRTISFGEERPFDTGSGEAAWAKNRRAHFTTGR